MAAKAEAQKQDSDWSATVSVAFFSSRFALKCKRDACAPVKGGKFRDAPLCVRLKQEAPEEQDAQDDEDGYDDDFYKTHNRHLRTGLVKVILGLCSEGVNYLIVKFLLIHSNGCKSMKMAGLAGVNRVALAGCPGRRHAKPAA